MEEIGLESSLLDSLIAEKRTVEARLAKARFKHFNVGDKIAIRRDIWKNGAIVESIPEAVYVEILGILPFESFKDLLTFIDYKRVFPGARSVRHATKLLRSFYSATDEKTHGVLAIEINLLAFNKH